jgi:hypothetical protein
MSGYLQRLAGSATRPRTRIHPLVGSVFSRPERSREPEAVSQAFLASSSDDPELVGREGQQQLLISKSRQSNEERSDRPQALKPKPIRQVPRRAAEFVEHPDEEQDFTSARRLQMEYRTEPLQEQELAERRSVDEFATIHETGGKEHRTDYVPLLAVTARGPQPKSQPVSSVPLAPAIPEPQKGQAPAAASHDEIQIHIGKIEVLAVPQTPPARIASSSRKGMSLEEYLRNRDRSTR